MIYVTSDLHGYPLEKFKALLRKAEFSENDFCFILGDVIDRGTDGVEILKWLLLQPNIAMVRGNHEEMLLACSFLFEEITDESITQLSPEKLRALMQWQRNGADPTMKALRRCDRETVLDILDYLYDTPYYDTVSAGGRDFLLVHGGLGGFDPKKAPEEYAPHDLIWTRPALEDRYFDDVITVFGHTPTAYYGSEYEGRAIFTDTWIDIDTGAARGGAPMLLRLDDLKEFYAD